MYPCPTCAHTRYQTKAGLTGAGSQRVRCGMCGTRSTAQPTPRGYDPAIRTQARKLSVEGMNFRRIARPFDLHHQPVINWVNAAAARLPAAAQAGGDPRVRCTRHMRRQQKKRTYIVTAVDRATHTIVRWAVVPAPVVEPALPAVSETPHSICTATIIDTPSRLRGLTRRS